MAKGDVDAEPETEGDRVTHRESEGEGELVALKIDFALGEAQLDALPVGAPSVGDTLGEPLAERQSVEEGH